MTTTTVPNTGASAAAMLKQAEPFMLQKRIGSTVYNVTVRFNPNATETLEDKILKLIGSEVTEIA